MIDDMGTDPLHLVHLRQKPVVEAAPVAPVVEAAPAVETPKPAKKKRRYYPKKK